MLTLFLCTTHDLMAFECFCSFSYFWIWNAYSGQLSLVCTFFPHLFAFITLFCFPHKLLWTSGMIQLEGTGGTPPSFHNPTPGQWQPPGLLLTIIYFKLFTISRCLFTAFTFCMRGPKRRHLTLRASVSSSVRRALNP